MRRALLLNLLLLAVAAAPAPAKVVYETYRVPTVDGAEIAVEVMRDDEVRRAPVLLTYSPYNTLYESRSGNLANDAYGQRYVKKGYARAVADVLGTRNSSGCWDYGGRKETQSGVDVVKFLASRGWSSGRVGMIGTSYDGTTANMVASRGTEVPELKAIVPIAAISRWYGYAYGDGVRFFLNSEEPTDEGIDTPLGFDFALTRTPPTDVDDPQAAQKLLSRVNPCDAIAHTHKGYDTSPDYDEFWLERDYRRHASRFRAAALVARTAGRTTTSSRTRASRCSTRCPTTTRSGCTSGRRRTRRRAATAGSGCSTRSWTGSSTRRTAASRAARRS